MKSTTSLLLLAAALGAMPWGMPGQVLDAGTPPAAAAADSLRLDEVLGLLAKRNPRLRASEAAAAAAAARVAESSTWPDPVLQIGVMNVGLPDLNADMASSMAPAIQLMQMVPFPGKPGLRGEVADVARSMADATASETWWTLRAEASTLFYGLYALDRRIEVMHTTLELLQSFQTVARSLYAAGTGRQADVLRADVEVARMDGEIRTLRARRTVVAARLNGLLDQPTGTAVPTPALGELPGTVPDADTLRRWAGDSRPSLERARLGVRQAGARLDLARKEIWPDLTVGVTYGQRDAGMGLERMGSAMVGFSLPVHAGKRQFALRDEASAMKRMAEAELGGLEADVGASIGERLADLDRARTLLGLYRDEVVPQARATVQSALSSYRVGAVDFMTLVDAQMAVNRYEAELFELLADYGTAVAGLESAIGRSLPPTDPILGATLPERDPTAREER